MPKGEEARPRRIAHLGIELQAAYPSNAVVAILRHDWGQFALHHGGGFPMLMRALLTVWYVVGHVIGLIIPYPKPVLRA